MCMNTSRHLTHVNLQFGSLLAPQWAATRPMSEVRKVLQERGFRKEAHAFYRKDHLNFDVFAKQWRESTCKWESGRYVAQRWDSYVKHKKTTFDTS